MGLFDILSGSNTPNIFDVVEFIDAVTSDPETDGKKDGYERAAKEYEPIYQELKQEYDNAIAEIQQKQHSYEVKCNTEISYSNAVASSSNLAIVAITKNFHLLDLGGLAVTIYRLITDAKFIRQIKEEFIFGSYKRLILGD